MSANTEHRIRTLIEARGIFSFYWRVMDNGRQVACGGPTPGRSRAEGFANQAKASYERSLRARGEL